MSRVAALLAQMTLEEKIAQIVSFWDKGDGEAVAPLQGQFSGDDDDLASVTPHGLGHLTRPYGTRPVDPVEQAKWLWDQQRRVIAKTPHQIPMLVHEETLNGLSVWGAATFPVPLSWGAAMDPELVARMAELIGESMNQLGVHQALAPVLDVIRDPRWGRVEECISEDPYVVGSIGTRYVQGLQSTGVHATLKHFVGYSGSQSGRNFGPVHAGPRELADVFLVPFEMAIKDGNAKSVMHAYNEIDGVPCAADPRLLTELLRDDWGFDGPVVADYFGVSFLAMLHSVAQDKAQAAELALRAGLDIELPSGDSFLEPLTQAVRSGQVPVELIDRAAGRALRQKEELGLLDKDFSDEPPSEVDLDSPAHRAVARELAEKSVLLLSNKGLLPLTSPSKIAVLGPNADRVPAMFGGYSFVNHVLSHHPGVEVGFEVPTVLDRVRSEWPQAEISFAVGCEVEGTDASQIADAVAQAQAADVAIVVVGDQAGLFGRGTVGEGSDRDSLELPGVQRQLVEAVLDAGVPLVLVMLTGRPYAVDWALDRAAAVVQSFFPGEEGAGAIAGVLSGRVNPSAVLPVSMPRSAGSQPFYYLHPQLGGDTDVTNLSSKPALPFGFGLSYTEFAYGELAVTSATAADDVLAQVTVTNAGQRAGEHVVQLFGRDVWASVNRPVAQLLAYQRVALGPGQSAQVTFRVPPARLAFSGLDLRRGVEPGEFELWVGNAQDRKSQTSITLSGEVHYVTGDAERWSTAEVASL